MNPERVQRIKTQEKQNCLLVPCVKSLKHLCVIILSLFTLTNPFYNLFAQTPKIDSLLTALKAEKKDTTRYNIFMKLGDCYQNQTPNTANIYYTKAAAIAEVIKDNIRRGEAISRVGWQNIVLGKYKAADSILQLTLELAESSSGIKAQKLKAAVLCSIGVLYEDESNLSQALDYFFKAMKIFEMTKNESGQASNFSDIGIVYMDEHNYTQALEYFFKALKMFDTIGDKNGQAHVLGNIGIIYDDEKNYQQAIDYDFKSLKLFQDLRNKIGQAISLSNIGSVHEQMGNYKQALDYLFKSEQMAETIGDKFGQAINLGSIGSIYSKTGNFKASEVYLKKAIAIDSSIGDRTDLQQFETYLSQLYDTTHRYQLALEWFKKSSVLKDSLFNINKDETITRKEVTFKFERQQDSIKSAQDKKDAVATSDKKRQEFVTASVSIGLLFVLIFSILLFNRFRITQKQKDLIEIQKGDVEKKNVLIETQKKLVEEKNKNHYCPR